MAASLLVGLSARLLQWQNPAEFGAQFLSVLQGKLKNTSRERPQNGSTTSLVAHV